MQNWIKQNWFDNKIVPPIQIQVTKDGSQIFNHKFSLRFDDDESKTQ